MDTEKSEVLDMPEAPNQEEVAVMENREEKVEPENPAAAVEAPEQSPVNDQAEEVAGQIVGENQENTEVLVDEGAKKSEGVESVAPSEPDDSTEKASDPVAAAEQPPVPENNPELPTSQTHLAEGAPEPEPEKSAEPAPVTEVQEQAVLSKAVEQQPAAEPSTKQETKEEPAVGEELSSEKPAQAASSEKEGSAEGGKDDSAQPGKEIHAQSASVMAAEPAQAEGVQSEPKEAQKEDVAPASGSLSFALLNQEQTKDALKVSRTLVVLRGLPGSGKSFLARAIADSYKDLCSVISADAHGIKPENPEQSTEGYKALDEAVVTCCKEGGASSVLIVVDDTNHIHDHLARLWEIAEEHNLVLIFLEPQTEWRLDVAQLAKKTKRQLDEAKLEAMKVQHEELSLPLYFGWFLLPAVQEKIRCTSMDFLKTLDTLEAFKKHLIDFTGKAEKEVDLEQYYKANGTLHCTTKFCNYGKVEGSKEYAQNPAVRSANGSVFELSLTALFVTPRTAGARVSLTEEQLLLWPADAEKEVESAVTAAASLPRGSRAHITLGCAEGTEPVQTGVDLLQILALQKEGQQGEPLEMELGSLIYYGEGRWMLTLREPIAVPACFSSFYAYKEQEPPKKEPEKKKQKKCSIL
uniref:2',3'-cyclic-nucleotide 3'-phosphodiesterase n=1 Tax=Oryzias sinensis TaxID=183150 RepID=A0A8C7WN67_9TELE